MNLSADIVDYNNSLDAENGAKASSLAAHFGASVPMAEGKVWHGHPVWFINGNPVFGYSLKKPGIEVLFWSGQSFKTPGLRAIGKFQAAGVAASDDQEFQSLLAEWLREAQAIQRDYKNLPKLRKLEKLTDF